MAISDGCLPCDTAVMSLCFSRSHCDKGIVHWSLFKQFPNTPMTFGSMVQLSLRNRDSCLNKGKNRKDERVRQVAGLAVIPVCFVSKLETFFLSTMQKQLHNPRRKLHKDIFWIVLKPLLFSSDTVLAVVMQGILESCISASIAGMF